MFRPGVMLIFMVIAIAHGVLLFQLIGQSNAPVNKAQKRVIQAMLFIAPVPTPTPKVAEKRPPIPKQKPSPKPEIKKKVVEAVREVPQEKLVEVPPVEISDEIKQPAIDKLLVPKVAEQMVEQTPPPLPDSEVEQELVLPPRINDAGHLKNPPPSYPRLSMRLREEGEVILELWVLAGGMVSEVEIKISSGYPRLDKAALSAVKKWRYTPATRNGQAVAYRYQQPIQFSMK